MSRDDQAISLWHAFSRRGFLAAIVGSANATPLANASLFAGEKSSVPKAASGFKLMSPKDAFILSVSAAAGSQVKVGDVVCQLDTEDEDRALDRISLAQALLALEDIKLTAANVASRRQVLELANTTAQAYSTFAKFKYELDDTAVNGLHFPIEPGDSPGDAEIGVQQDIAAMTKANSELTKTTLALQRFDFTIQQLKQKQTLLEAQLSKEKDRVTADKARMTIVAPVAGIISLNVAANCFVEKGSYLAEIAETGSKK